MKKFLPLLIFLTISAGLIFSWFRDGFIYGGGDVLGGEIPIILEVREDKP